jgi:hypothetical protein
MKTTTRTFFLVTALSLFLTVPAFAVEPTIVATKNPELLREVKKELK